MLFSFYVCLVSRMCKLLNRKNTERCCLKYVFFKLGKADTLNKDTTQYNTGEDKHNHLSYVKLTLIKCNKRFQADFKSVCC